MLEDEIHWFSIDLGDAILATTSLYALQDTLEKIYQESGRCEVMRAYYRHESGDTHCKATVYITAAFQQALCRPDALVCKAPQHSDLSFLAGKP